MRENYSALSGYEDPQFPWGIIAVWVCVILAVMLLVGCSTLPKVVDVPIPTPVYCKPAVLPEPDYPDTSAKLKAAPDIFEAAKLLLEGRVMRIEREAELKAALQACEAPPSDQPQHP